MNAALNPPPPPRTLHSEPVDDGTFAAWCRDLRDWPGPALIINPQARIVAVNALAEELGIRAGAALSLALDQLCADRGAPSRCAQPDGRLRFVPIDASDFSGWFVDASEGANDAERPPQASVARLLAESNMRLQEEIWRRRRAERRILNVAESQARRISLELHDTLGQHLTGLAFFADTLAKDLEESGHPRAADAGWLVRLAKDAIVKTRGLSQELWPVSLDRESLASALTRLVEHTETLYGISAKLDLVDEPKLLDPTASYHVYRIVQEAVTNAVKHGKARRVVIRSEVFGDDLHMSIANDGLTLNIASLRQAQGIGVAGMWMRADALGAELSIEPLPAGGAEVLLILPGVAAVRNAAGRR